METTQRSSLTAGLKGQGVRFLQDLLTVQIVM